MTGVGRFLRERNPHVQLILADPAGSVLAPLVNCGEKIKPGSWLVEGMGEDFVPVLQLYLEHGVRQRLDDGALDLDGALLFGHVLRVSPSGFRLP